jgi:hypothetical protein
MMLILTHGNEVNETGHYCPLPEGGGQNFQIVVDWRRFALRIPLIRKHLKTLTPNNMLWLCAEV